MSNSTSETTYLSARKNKKSFTKKFNHIIKTILMPYYQYQNKRKKNKRKSKNNSLSATTVAVSVHNQEKYCCGGCDSSPSTRDSITIVDGPQQPWIVPSEYHKNMSGTSLFLIDVFGTKIGINRYIVPNATSGNHWIFRTGWTPQPDPLAFLNSGWCVNCNSCVAKDQKQCSFCDANPLIVSDYQHRMRNIIEIEEIN